MSWVHGNWSQDETVWDGFIYLNTQLPIVFNEREIGYWFIMNSGVMGGYPYVKTAPTVERFDVSVFGSIYTMDQYSFGGFPCINTAPSIEPFDISQFDLPWECADAHHGFPHIKTSNADVMGAFWNTPSLTYVEIPSCVTEIGEYSFRNSGLTHVHVPSACVYEDTTFPENCVIDTD